MYGSEDVYGYGQVGGCHARADARADTLCLACDQSKYRKDGT